MTREEVTNVLKKLQVMYRVNTYVVESIDMAIKALQAEQEDEPKFYDEDDYWNGRVPTHGRLIDADVLSKKLCETTIFIKDGEVFQRMINDAPTVQADRPHGEWVKSKIPNELYVCSNCGGACWSYDYERTIVKSNFCPNCGADMNGYDRRRAELKKLKEGKK